VAAFGSVAVVLLVEVDGSVAVVVIYNHLLSTDQNHDAEAVEAAAETTSLLALLWPSVAIDRSWVAVDRGLVEVDRSLDASGRGFVEVDRILDLGSRVSWAVAAVDVVDCLSGFRLLGFRFSGFLSDYRWDYFVLRERTAVLVKAIDRIHRRHHMHCRRSSYQTPGCIAEEAVVASVLLHPVAAGLDDPF
jgi:hypothetical protein